MKIKNKTLYLVIVILVSIFLFACGKETSGNGSTNPSNTGNDSVKPGEPDDKDDPVKEPEIDTKPVVLKPEASKVQSEGNTVTQLDYSNVSKGYVIVNYKGSNPKVRMLLTGPDGIKYTYVLNGGEEVFPLTGGSGKYQIGVYENLSGNSYLPVFTYSFSAELESEFISYLYPNQYVNFNENSNVVKVGEEVSKGAHSKLEIVEKVYNYVMKTLTYDTQKAETVKSGYIPNVDEILDIKTGICFDYASVMAAMLRSQEIPTMLQIGYSGKIYHAWISVYTKETGWINGIIEFDGLNWKRMDPTFADSSNQSKQIMEYISNADNYKIMYKH